MRKAFRAKFQVGYTSNSVGSNNFFNGKLPTGDAGDEMSDYGTLLYFYIFIFIAWFLDLFYLDQLVRRVVAPAVQLGYSSTFLLRRVPGLVTLLHPVSTPSPRMAPNFFSLVSYFIPLISRTT